jgi:hypothetical protein
MMPKYFKVLTFILMCFKIVFSAIPEQCNFAIEYAQLKSGSKYRVKCIPLSLFPFFCTKLTKSDIKLIEQEKGHIHSGSSFSIKSFLDSKNKRHIRIATVQNVFSDKGILRTKVYRYFFIIQDVITKECIEERPMIIAKLDLVNHGQYGCR